MPTLVYCLYDFVICFTIVLDLKERIVMNVFSVSRDRPTPGFVNPQVAGSGRPFNSLKSEQSPGTLWFE